MRNLYILLFSLGLLVTGCVKNQVAILQGVSQDDANRIVFEMSYYNIDAKKVQQKDGYDILVPENKSLQALKVLQDDNEPRNKYSSFGEIFKKDGFISSPLEEQARYTYALNQEIEHSISLIDGITNVRVIVSLPLPTNSLWRAEVQKPAASVLIKFKQGYRIDLLSSRIKLLVSNSVPGLTPDMVEVLPLQRKSDL
jgi:type III secretion protein J